MPIPSVTPTNNFPAISGEKHGTMQEGTLNGKPVTVIFRENDQKYQIIKEGEFEIYTTTSGEKQVAVRVNGWKNISKKDATKSLADKFISVLHSDHSKLKDLTSYLINKITSIPSYIRKHPKTSLYLAATLVIKLGMTYFSGSEKAQEINCPGAAKLGLFDTETFDYNGILCFKHLEKIFQC